MDDKYLLWLDLETTGGNEQADPVLEVGLVVTAAEWPFEAVLMSTDNGLGRSWVVRQMPGWRQRMEDVVREMHDANGLAAEVDEAEKTIFEVDVEAHAFVQARCGEESKVTMAGSGVGHFDYRFVRRQLPTLASRLDYGVMDVGVIRRFLRMIDRADLVRPEEEKAHRALPDALDHLEEFRRYARLIREARHAVV